MKRKILGFLLLLLAVSAHAQKQRFFNLTVEDVTIDSLLPHFTYAIPIGENYADSIYQLEIRYPEFLDMNATDVAPLQCLVGCTASDFARDTTANGGGTQERHS